MPASWHIEFKQLYEKALRRYAAGDRDHTQFFDQAETAFLDSIGCRSIEVFDLAEDADAIDWETALLITATRLSYFREELNRIPAAKSIPESAFPLREAEADGIPWLPRLIAKARAKLRGELPEELMFCCGGDRKFFREYGIHPSDFLRLVWLSRDDDQRIVDWIKSREIR